MVRPDFLDADDSGFFSIRGHRIGLHHIIRHYINGGSPEMIAAHYPTLPLATVHKVIAFYLENQAAVDQYVAEQETEVERQMAGQAAAPSLSELRARLAQRAIGAER
jgi:uncharacterized protein (DUF433 family)